MEVAGSLGSSPPEGVICGFIFACDPVLRSARGSLQVLTPRIKGCGRCFGVTRCMLGLSQYRTL